MRSKGWIALFIMMPVFLYADYNKALKLFEQEKYDEALSIVAALLDVSKDFEPNAPNYDLRYLAAHIHAKKGNFENAITHLKRCAEIKKDIADPLIDIAFIYVDQKKYTEAITWARKAIQIKQDPVAYYILGLSFAKIGSYWQAKEYLEKSISISPDLYYVYNELGNVLMYLKRLTQAQTAYSAAYSLEPESSIVCNNLAINYALLGDTKRATELIEKARKLDPSNEQISSNYTYVMKLRNK